MGNRGTGRGAPRKNERGAPRPPGRARAEPAQEMDDRDESVAPPLPGKTNPPAAMDDAKPSLDDEVQRYHEHPRDHAAAELGVEPDAADAAADLAGDLGATFLTGATRGEDMSDVAMSMADREENDLPFLIESELEEEPEEEASERPRPRRSGLWNRL